MDQSMFPPSLWAAYFDGQTDKLKGSEYREHITCLDIPLTILSGPKKRRKLDDLDQEGEDKVEEVHLMMIITIITR